MNIDSCEKMVLLGKIVGLHGIKGGLKIHSYCRPREDIFKYSNFIGIRKDKEQFLLSLNKSQISGKSLVMFFDDIVDRDIAISLIGTDLMLKRADLPALPEGEFYWFDLIGLIVKNRNSEILGKVEEIFPTGANDVLSIRDGKNSVLIPLIYGKYVEKVDFDAGILFVDWERNWLD